MAASTPTEGLRVARGRLRVGDAQGQPDAGAPRRSAAAPGSRGRRGLVSELRRLLGGARPGFTFLELLVALAILGASFTVLLSAHTSAARQEARARRLMTATLLAREVLTETEVEGFPDLGEEQGDFGEEFPDYSWARRVETTEFDRVRLVYIEVFWPERGDRASTEVVYYAVGDEP